MKSDKITSFWDTSVGTKVILTRQPNDNWMYSFEVKVGDIGTIIEIRNNGGSALVHVDRINGSQIAYPDAVRLVDEFEYTDDYVI